MKILIFSPYFPPHTGGLENYTEELCREMSKTGVQIIVFTSAIPIFIKNQLILDKIEIIRFPAFEIVSNYPLPKFWSLKFWLLFYKLFKNNFDIVVSQTRFFNTTLLALIYAKIKNNKWIHIEHGSDFVLTASPLVNIISRLYDLTIGKLVFKLSDSNIAISRAAQKFVERFDKRKTYLIYRGLDMEAIDREIADENMIAKFKGKKVVAFTGRLSKWKGVANGVRAVVSLPKVIKKQVVFIIAGNGEEFEKIQNISDDSIIMLGNVSRQKVFQILKCADIFIHASLPGGGLATSLLEAMYCKCAIIATSNEGADEVIENGMNGILINDSNPNVIKDKIIELVQSEEKRSEYSQKAKEKIANLFTWDKAVESMMVVFKHEIFNK